LDRELEPGPQSLRLEGERRPDRQKAVFIVG
jgi:hypothetical protein